MGEALAGRLKAEGLDIDILLAILAHAGLQLTSDDSERGENIRG
jgi:hypothetical protein